MSGYNALWVPGMDHNGFATQVSNLKNEYGIVLRQLWGLGASLDWSNESFNTNEKRSMVLADKNFVRLQEEGFIYREFQHWMCFFQCHQPDDSPLIRPTILSGIMGTRSWVPIRYRNKTQPRELSLVTMLTDSLRVPIDIPCMVYLESIFSAYRALLPTEPSKRSSRHKFKRISHSVGQSIPSGETWMESIVHSLGKLGWKVLFIR